MSGPLTGVRVIDLTAVAMGPYATQILGDMGADVIKVESRDGDIFRQAAPFRNRGMGAAYLNLNRNKRSIVLDLKGAKDREIIRELIEGADVFVYNVRPQSMRKLGLSYESLREMNPRLIYCGAYGFAERGRYAGQPAFDDIIQGMSGLAWLQGVNGTKGPEYINTIMADKTTGLFVAYAIAMALYERERSGIGQEIEVPMFESMVSYNLVEHMAGETFCPPVDGMGYGRVLSPYRKPYRTRDGYLGLLPYTTEQWQRFFALADRPDLVSDRRVTDAATRSAHIDELYATLSSVLIERTTEEWVSLLKDADIPMTNILSLEEVLNDEHLRGIEFFQQQTHHSEGEIRSIGIPIRFSRTPGAIRRQAPQLGEHNAEIFEEIACRRRENGKNTR